MAGTFSRYSQVNTNYAFSTPALVDQTNYEDVNVLTATIVPLNIAVPCDVEVSIIRAGVTTVIIRESLAAGDYIVDTTNRYMKPNDFYNVVVSTPCDVSISGSWS